MSKGILEFSLPEEQNEFKMATDAGRYASMLHEYDQYLRSLTKYAPESQTEAVTDALQAAREKLWELANNESVEF